MAGDLRPRQVVVSSQGWLVDHWRTVNRLLGRSGVAGSVLSLIIVMGIFTIGTGGRYLAWSNLQVILNLAPIPAIIALGLHQTIVLGSIDLSVEGVVALCCVVVGILIGNPTYAAAVGLWILPIVLVFGGIAGLVSGLLNTKLRIPSFISTLGMSWLLWGLAIYISKSQTVPLLYNPLQHLVTGNLLGIPYLALIALALFIVLQIVQDRTRLGRYLYAIGGDEIVAQQAGVQVHKVKIVVFTTAGVLYGLAALFLAIRLGSSQAITGNNLLFPAITAVSVGGVALTGGVGGAKNAVLGTLVITALNDGLILMHVNPYVQDAVNGVVLIAAVAITIDRRKLGFIK